MTDETFPPELRLRRGADFQRVYARRRSAADNILRVCVCENDLPHARVGLSVSRRVGNAVVRNRWKRLLREAFRKSKDDLPTGVDMVLIPQSREGAPSLDELTKSLVRVSRQAAARLRRGAS